MTEGDRQLPEEGRFVAFSRRPIRVDLPLPEGATITMLHVFLGSHHSSCSRRRLSNVVPPTVQPATQHRARN
jgi:hypothetical protein